VTKTEPKSFKDMVGKFQNTLFGRQKYVKNEFQAYGLELAKELHDWQNRSLYIRLAKQVDRQLLDTARYFVKDHIPGAVKSPKKLFMWKLKSLKSAV
jgi:hypothetical protein